MRYHRISRDANHALIVRTLEAVGCSVLDLSAVGGGCPDLCVGYRGVTHLFEIKSSAAGRDRHNRKDQQHQADWHTAWRGRPVVIVRSEDDALLALALPTPGRLSPSKDSGSPPASV